MKDYFSDEELRCQCGCGQLKFDPIVRNNLNHIREDYGKPMYVTSGYRCEQHPIEARKEKPGEHSTGMCVDIACSGWETAELTQLAIKYGATRIGWNQKGGSRFIHMGWSTTFTKGTWTY